MPIYEYRCTSCERSFEAFVRATDAARCPHCYGSSLTREMSTFASRSSNSNGLAVAEQAIANSGARGGIGGGGCCGGGCGCH